MMSTSISSSFASFSSPTYPFSNTPRGIGVSRIVRVLSVKLEIFQSSLASSCASFSTRTYLFSNTLRGIGINGVILVLSVELEIFQFSFEVVGVPPG